MRDLPSISPVWQLPRRIYKPTIAPWDDHLLWILSMIGRLPIMTTASKDIYLSSIIRDDNYPLWQLLLPGWLPHMTTSQCTYNRTIASYDNYPSGWFYPQLLLKDSDNYSLLYLPLRLYMCILGQLNPMKTTPNDIFSLGQVSHATTTHRICSHLLL